MWQCVWTYCYVCVKAPLMRLLMQAYPSQSVSVTLRELDKFKPSGNRNFGGFTRQKWSRVWSSSPKVCIKAITYISLSRNLILRLYINAYVRSWSRGSCSSSVRKGTSSPTWSFLSHSFFLHLLLLLLLSLFWPGLNAPFHRTTTTITLLTVWNPF